MTILQLGPYPIEREVGRGGMGIVYLGRDPRLGRSVAIKVLPDAFARDPERLARFQREARLLASLTHPNIAGIYGIEESEGRHFLALEYVEGQTLAERLERGPLPLDETLDVCRQIAAALEAAHDAGIVHRDLKPGNVKLTPGGDVKVLDFGLARGGGTVSEGSSDLSMSPTVAISPTEVGVILGTAAYMSPEQARGRPVDRRTDIWSFGCVLYECLTGAQAFAGETVSDMIALILQGTPDATKLPKNTPEALRALLARCLEKDAKRRLRDIGEARLELEALQSGAGARSQTSGMFAGPTIPTAKPAKRGVSRELTITIVGALLASVVGVLATKLLDRDKVVAPDYRFIERAPAGMQFSYEPNDYAVSADGKTLALVATDSTGTKTLWVRPFRTFEARMLPGTRNATLPFWSPDGSRLGFFADGKLKTLRLEGGNPEVVSDAPSPRGACWTRRGDILFSANSSGPIQRVRASGGAAVAVTVVDTADGETSHRFPQIQRDGNHFTYVSIPVRNGHYPVWLAALGKPGRTKLMDVDTAPVPAGRDWLLFTRNDALLAQRVNVRGSRMVGEPASIGEAPAQSTLSGSPRLSASPSGAMTVLSEGPREARLAWLGRDGREIARLSVPIDRWRQAILSDDDRRAVIERATPSGTELWILDVERQVVSRLTSAPGENTASVWSPDGRTVMFSGSREGRRRVYRRASDGSGQDEVFYSSSSPFMYPSEWSIDGRTVLIQEVRSGTGWDVMKVDVGTREAIPLLVGEADELYAFLSPDERWLIYQSSESGAQQTWVCAYPSLEHKQLVDPSATFIAVFMGKSREIMLIRADQMLVMVPVEFGPTLRLGRPRELFRLPRTAYASYPVSDASRFLTSIQASDQEIAITVSTNWRTALPKR